MAVIVTSIFRFPWREPVSVHEVPMVKVQKASSMSNISWPKYRDLQVRAGVKGFSVGKRG